MSVNVSVSAENLVARLRGIEDRMHADLLRVMRVLAIDIQGYVMGEKLTGQVLNVRTGNLRTSINQKVVDSTTSIRGSVGTNIWYGALWEQGFDRKVGAGARGGPRTLFGRALERYQLQHPPAVKHYPARSFLASALKDMEQRIISDIKDAAKGALK